MESVPLIKDKHISKCTHSYLVKEIVDANLVVKINLFAQRQSMRSRWPARPWHCH